jgi:predicted RecB family nuclease
MPAMASKITLDVLKGYLNCKFKTHLLLAERQGIKSDYEVMLSESRRELRLKAIEKINSQYPERAIVKGIVLTRPALSEGAPLILDADLHDKHFSIHFDGLRKVEGHSVLGDFHYLPVLYCETRRIDRVHRILLEVLAIFLSRIQAKTVSRGIIYYGSNCNTAIVRFTDRLQTAENLLANVIQMKVGEVPPPLLLNKHCHVCEFRQECHANAIKEDNLSLLRALGERKLEAMVVRACSR